MCRENPELARRVVDVLREAASDDVNRGRARAAYRSACNAVFQPEFEASVIRPLAMVLCHPDYPVDDGQYSSYISLFRHHGVEEYDTRRRSFLEYWDVGTEKHFVMSLLQRVGKQRRRERR